MTEEKINIIMIRHGNTAYNSKKIFRGRLNVPLDEEGKEQAEKTGKFLKNINLDVIFTSPIDRALQTAKVIQGYQKKNIKLIEEPGFTDLSFGEWENKSYDEVEKKYPDLFNAWLFEPYDVKVPGGESLSEALERSLEALNGIIKEREYKTICIVTHRVITKVLINYILGISQPKFWQIKQDPCCINYFEYAYNSFYISKINYNLHIKNFKEIVDAEFKI